MGQLNDETSALRVQRQGRVACLRLNRPQALNALNAELRQQLIETAEQLDADPEIGCLLLLGSDKAFSAGADIRELSAEDTQSMHQANRFVEWERFARLRTPKIAAVAGVALGGGLELAMMCDLILAAESARLGQPEIKLGCLPGMGGTQRLSRLVGRALAMDLILTGRLLSAAEALQAGLVSRVCPLEALEEQALAVAQTIAAYDKGVVMRARDCVLEAEVGLDSGLRFERQSYHAVFGSAAQQEGMQAFLQKRPACFHPE